MKKIVKPKPQKEKSIDVLKKVAKRVEDAAIDINEMKRSLRFVNLGLGQVEHNTELMKVDMEKMRGEMGEKLIGLETRLNKRITKVADLITINLGDKLQNYERRIRKLERTQQTV